MLGTHSAGGLNRLGHDLWPARREFNFRQARFGAAEVGTRRCHCSAERVRGEGTAPGTVSAITLVKVSRGTSA